MRPYKVPRSKVQDFVPRAWDSVDRLALYVHVPFCEKRCGYCEYTVLDPHANAENESVYFDLLQREFELYRQALGDSPRTLIGFDIGGGTPSAVHPRHIEAVIQAAYRGFYIPETMDISIETTPVIAARQPEKIAAYQQMGIRRISMGVQTVSPALLQAVGREHSSLALNLSAAENIRRAGFKKFNVDVMYGFAGQSVESVEATLRHVIDLSPEYVTLYRMRYKGTRLAHQAGGIDLDEVMRQARLAKRLLLEAGYHGTPGKNTFSRLPRDPGTSHYLTERVVRGAPYLGLGLGAQSLSHLSLAYNSGAADKRLEHYRRQVEAGQLPVQDAYHLSRPAAMGKMISVAFYFGEIHLDSFAAKFGLPLEAAFPCEVEFVIQEGLMEYWPRAVDRQTLRLTTHGEDNVNGVIALFYAGAVKQHLLEHAAGERLL
jgi:oxygen-independent coproporphyrinogen-3 oxidase